MWIKIFKENKNLPRDLSKICVSDNVIAGSINSDILLTNISSYIIFPHYSKFAPKYLEYLLTGFILVPVAICPPHHFNSKATPTINIREVQEKLLLAFYKFINILSPI